MLKQAKNEVHIEGLLSEVDLNYGSFKKGDKTVNSIGGIIKIQVNETIGGSPVMLEVPVHMFAPELTNKGTPNPAYQNIEKIKNEFTSIAAAGGIEGADAVRINSKSAKIVMNEFPNQNGVIVSYPRIVASFVNKIKKEEMAPCAEFAIDFVVGKKIPEVDKEGIETGRYKITGVVPQYGGKVDVVEFLAVNPKAIESINQYWNENDTVSAGGRLNFSSRMETIKKEWGFGEAEETTRTYSVNELIITRGNPDPVDNDLAYDINEIKEALAERKARHEQMLEKAKNSPSKTRSTPVADSNGRVDLGF